MFDDLHFSIILVTIFTFLIIMVILNAVFYKPLLKFMDERDESIKKDEERIKDNDKEMLSLEDEFELIHINTRDEIHKIKQNALNVAKEEAELLIKAKKEELERKMASFYSELNLKRQELENELKIHLPDLKQSLKRSIERI